MSKLKKVNDCSAMAESIICTLGEKFLDVAIVDDDTSTMFDTLDLMVYVCLIQFLKEEQNFSMDFLLPMREQFAKVYDYFKC